MTGIHLPKYVGLILCWVNVKNNINENIVRDSFPVPLFDLSPHAFLVSGPLCQLPLLTWLVPTARLLTVYIATADPALLANFGLSLLLNSAIICAVVWYAEGPQKKEKKKTK